MKKSHILGLIMIAVAIFIFLTAAKDVSTYSTFLDASKKTSKVKISGTLAKDKILTYDPEKDPNYFSFYLTDASGQTKQVILSQPKPQDFELAEQIVVTGKFKNDVFAATDVLTKCPSKYKDEELYLESEI